MKQKYAVIEIKYCTNNIYIVRLIEYVNKYYSEYATHVSIDGNEWIFGHYFTKYQFAVEDFNERVGSYDNILK